MSQQVKRLLIAFLIFISLFLMVRHFLVPDSYYKYGNYRADALKDNETHEIKYINSKECSNCHLEEDSLKFTGAHKDIRCQTCHGPGFKHIEDPSANAMIKPTERIFCGKCHAFNAARPKSIITQQDISKHNAGSKCIECHNPHQP